MDEFKFIKKINKLTWIDRTKIKMACWGKFALNADSSSAVAGMVVAVEVVR